MESLAYIFENIYNNSSKNDGFITADGIVEEATFLSEDLHREESEHTFTESLKRLFLH